MQALRGATLALGLQVNRLRIQRCAPAQAKNEGKPAAARRARTPVDRLRHAARVYGPTFESPMNCPYRKLDLGRKDEVQQPWRAKLSVRRSVIASPVAKTGKGLSAQA